MLPDKIQKLLDDKNWNEVINTITAMPKNNLNDELLEQLGWCYSRAENYSKAIEVFDEFIAKQPNVAKWYYMKGYQFYMQQNWSQAAELFSKALEIYPEYFVVKYRLAYAYMKIASDNMKWANAAFWKAVKHLEDSHRLFSGYSKDEKIKNNATYASICALHGKSILDSNVSTHIKRAVELLTLSLEIKSDDYNKYQLAKAYLNLKEYDNALKALPQDSRKYYVPELEAEILAESGKHEESLRILLKLTQRNKKDYLCCRAAENYLALNDLDNAEKFALLAKSVGASNYKNYLICAEVYKRKEQYKTAIDLLEQSRAKKQLKFKHDCPEAIRLIDEIHSIRERLNKDIEVYRDSVISRAVDADLKFFSQEEERLNKWSEDMIYAVERELDQIKKQIKQLEKESRQSTSVNEKLELQQKLTSLNNKKRTMRTKLDEAEEDIIKQRKNYIAEIKARKQMTNEIEELFTIQWEVT